MWCLALHLPDGGVQSGLRHEAGQGGHPLGLQLRPVPQHQVAILRAASREFHLHLSPGPRYCLTCPESVKDSVSGQPPGM